MSDLERNAPESGSSGSGRGPTADAAGTVAAVVTAASAVTGFVFLSPLHAVAFLSSVAFVGVIVLAMRSPPTR
jgi:hypothetical protein